MIESDGSAGARSNVESPGSAGARSNAKRCGDLIERWVDADRARVFVRDHGAGPALVLGHSLGFDSELWDAQVTALADRWRVLAIDFRGHGRTFSTGPFTLDDLAQDVVCVLDALAIERAVYAGLSLGGMVGMRLALRFRDRLAGLLLANTSADPEEPERRRLFEAYNEHARTHPGDIEGAALMMTLMFSQEFLVARPDVTRRFRDKLLRTDLGDARYFAACAVLARSSMRAEIADIGVPTVVVGSTGDTALPIAHARAIAAAIPGSTLRVVDGGHASAVEQPEALSAALYELLDRAFSRR